MYEIVCGSLDKNEITIDKNELSSRLLIPRGYEVEIADKCEKMVRDAVFPKYCYIKNDVKLLDGGYVDLGFAVFKSYNLHKNLQDCKSAYVMAMTLGIAVDRLVSRLAVTSAAESFVADAVASAFAEAAIDRLSELLAENAELKPRFSPGYGDLELLSQKAVLAAVNAEKLIGITLGDNLLMTPFKSVSAVQGIRLSKNKKDEYKCQTY